RKLFAEFGQQAFRALADLRVAKMGAQTLGGVSEALGFETELAAMLLGHMRDQQLGFFGNRAEDGAERLGKIAHQRLGLLGGFLLCRRDSADQSGVIVCADLIEQGLEFSLGAAFGKRLQRLLAGRIDHGAARRSTLAAAWASASFTLRPPTRIM